MLVIHPKDRTTAFLSALYEGMDDTLVFTGYMSRGKLSQALCHTAKDARILLLGHGGKNGLFWRKDDSQPYFDGIILGHPHAYHLRNHGCNLVAIFCNADKFAREEHLHGLFTGMIISELGEAVELGIETTEEELASENIKFAGRLRSLLDKNIPLHEVPQRMLELDDRHTPLTAFNYQRIYFL